MAFAAFFDCKCIRDSHQLRMVTDPSDLLSAVPCAYALWAGTVRGLLQLWDETETFSRCQQWIQYFKLVERDSLSLLGALGIGDADFITRDFWTDQSSVEVIWNSVKFEFGQVPGHMVLHRRALPEDEGQEMDRLIGSVLVASEHLESLSNLQGPKVFSSFLLTFQQQLTQSVIQAPGH